MLKKIGLVMVMLMLTATVASAQGTVEEVAPQFDGFAQAGDYRVKVSLDDVKGRLAVQLLNQYGEAKLTGIPKVTGSVEFADGTVKEVTFRPERTYWNESEGNYSDTPIGYSSTYYVMGGWLQGVGCVDTTVTVEGQELTFTCDAH
jgi:hypothetical protein